NLAALAEVRSVTTLDALVPDDQDEKQLVLEDIGLLMGPGFADLERAPFDAARLERALDALRGMLADAEVSGVEAEALRRALVRLSGKLADPSAARDALAGLDSDIADGLPYELGRLDAALTATPFDVDAL